MLDIRQLNKRMQCGSDYRTPEIRIHLNTEQVLVWNSNQSCDKYSSEIQMSTVFPRLFVRISNHGLKSKQKMVYVAVCCV